ncbi:MAG: hypothetical protein CVU71_07230 [Deltaproteobacteria bacterium HGW-Deltaproteobacteria-6]|nr:MAG: hypothetical protein CVU71_07230 [Deltaproteobacteria bacterium HGW-Deltaproteobacteria-6]
MITEDYRNCGLTRNPAIVPWLCNMGSPMTRRESERIIGSLLGEHGRGGGAKLSNVMTVGLKFEAGSDPVTATYEILQRAGLYSPEDLRCYTSVPEGPMICVLSDKVIPTAPDKRREKDFLFLTSALILGLCTATFYDPARPVIWTQTSLTRKIRLFSPGGFYASA